MNKGNIVARFAPSPTGWLHVGGVRSALFNYLYAKHNGGKIILRIEDTDKERSKKEYEEDIIQGFKWLGLEFDETNRQSDRTHVYKKYLEQMIEKGQAYISKETPKEAGERSEVIRFKNPNRIVAFDDLIKGRIEVDTTDLKDFVIAKSIDEPIFHLSNVIDDLEMGITHVIRGEEHVSNTPRQILIWEAIGGRHPVYAHIPLILAADRSKLSKRKSGETVWLKYYQDRGYLPAAIINFLALLGWNPGDNRELFNLEDLIKEFRIERVQKSGAIFDVEKLNWMNKEYLNQLPREQVLNEIKKRIDLDEKLAKLSKIQKDRLCLLLSERIRFYGEVNDSLSRGEYDYLSAVPPYEKEKLLWKQSPDLTVVQKHITAVISLIEKLPEFPSAEEAKSAVWPYADANGRGNVLWPLRYALSGRDKSPDPFTLISLLGKNESLGRLKAALDLLK